MNIKLHHIFIAFLIFATTLLYGKREIFVPGDYEFVGKLIDISEKGFYLYKVYVEDGESLELFKEDSLIPKDQSLQLKLNDQIVDLYGTDEIKKLKNKKVRIVVTGNIRSSKSHYEFLVSDIYELDEFKK